MPRISPLVLLFPALLLIGCSRAPTSSAAGSDTPGGPPAANSSAADTNSSAPAASSTSANDVAPAWTLKNLDGKPVSLSDFKGKVVVLDIWATWCPPCRAEIPHFIEIQNEYKDKGVTVVGMSVDSTGPADVAKFVKDNGMNYPIVMADEATATAYGADQGIPFTLVIDKNGNVVSRHLGLTDKEVFEDDIKKALAE
jgi:thiol-disulfide isomerase/thioredoxin